MLTFLVVLTFVSIVLLILVTAMVPQRSSMSHYELQRRANMGDKEAKQDLKRQELLGDIISLLRVDKALLLVLVSFLLVAVCGWGWGIVLAVGIALFHGSIARLGIIKMLAGVIYGAIEPKIIQAVERAPFVFSLIRSRNEPNVDFTIDSRQELEYLIEQSQDVLSHDEKKLVVHSLAFSDKVVRDIMTPVKDIVSISKTEFLGPLTLNDLHQSGHSRLPVIAQDIDHIVGILYLRNLLTLDTKRSVTAEKAMDSHVMYVHQDQTLPHALAALLRSHHHLFIVIDESRATVGLITLEDVIEALIGRKIVDEFDGHESIRAVAEHAHSRKHTDH